MKKDISIETIITTVCSALEIERTKLVGRTRKGEIVDARSIAISLIRNNHKISQAKVGNLFSGLDHSTINFYENRHVDLYFDNVYLKKFNRVMAVINQD